MTLGPLTMAYLRHVRLTRTATNGGRHRAAEAARAPSARPRFSRVRAVGAGLPGPTEPAGLLGRPR